MKPDVTIRIANPEDRETVFALAEELATSFSVEIEPFRDSFADIIGDPSAICLVAEGKSGIVGYLLGFDHRAFYANGFVSWVEEIFVIEDLRREGLGEALMKHFEDWCIERGSKLVGLATRRASDFYKAINYEESAIFFRKLLAEDR